MTKPTPEALAKMGLEYGPSGLIQKIGTKPHPDVIKAEAAAENKPKNLSEIEGYTDGDLYIEHVLPMQEEQAIEQINDYVKHIDDGNDWAERNQQSVDRITGKDPNFVPIYKKIDIQESNPAALLGNKIPVDQKSFDGKEHKKFYLDEVGLTNTVTQGFDIEEPGPDVGMFNAVQTAVKSGAIDKPEKQIKKSPFRIIPVEPEMEIFKQPVNNGIMNERIYLGIDPGKSGGIVALSSAGHVVDKWPMPILGDNLDVSAMFDLFQNLNDMYSVTVILEDVHSIFGMSAATNFIFGYVCGAIEAVVLCLKLKVVKVAPKTWQKEIWANGDKVYKTKKPDQKNPSTDTKATSLCAVLRLFPHEDLRKSARAKIAADGIVDALLLAEYGRRKNL